MAPSNNNRIVHILLGICMIGAAIMVFGFAFLVFLFSLGTWWLVSLVILGCAIFQLIAAILLIIKSKSPLESRQKTTLAAINLVAVIFFIGGFVSLSNLAILPLFLLGLVSYIISTIGIIILSLRQKQNTETLAYSNPLTDIPIGPSAIAEPVITNAALSPSRDTNRIAFAKTHKPLINTLLAMPVILIGLSLFILPFIIQLPGIKLYRDQILLVTFPLVFFLGFSSLAIGLLMRHDMHKKG